MGFMSVLSYAHFLMAHNVQPGEVAVDATVGNGVDTLFLAKTVGARGTVYGFDIQQEALDRAAERFRNDGSSSEQVRWIHGCHSRMLEHVAAEHHGRVGGVMFNLGYLPGGDLSCVTLPASTLQALDAALTLLRKGGIISIILYTGHDGGAAEASAVEDWAAGLSSAEHEVLRYQFANRRNAPYLLAIGKR